MDSKMYVIAVIFLVSFGSYSQSQTIQSCCSHVSQWNECYTACMQFASPSCAPNVENKTLYLQDYCPQIPSTLSVCFDNFTSNTETTPTPPSPLINCCKKSTNENCKNVCIEQVTLGNFNDAAIQIVIGACGPPLTPSSDPIWNCFLLFANQEGPSDNGGGQETNTNCSSITTSTPPTSITPSSHTIKYADWPRLHCCSKANDSACSEACLYEFTGSRTTSSWEKLNLDCLYRANEGELTSCLNDVTSRCSTGCPQLNFCSKFNNRPFTSFRNCSIAADTNAKLDYTRWVTNSLIYHPLVTFYTKNLTTCLPDWWKLVACTFNMMPCQSNRDTSIICKEDCLFLMNACKRMITQNVEEVCEILSPSYLQTDCISVRNYLNVSNYTKERIDNELTTPCTSNPCTKGKCVINQECKKDMNCQPYYCVDESKIGITPKLIVKKLDTIRVTTSPFNEDQRCHGYVNCTMKSGQCVYGGKASNVSDIYCIDQASCIYKGMNYSHNEIFNDDCNICHCYSNHVNCTNHICRASNGNTLSTCTPPQCNCPPFYEPVCTNNGLIMPNVHFTNCHGYSFGKSCTPHNVDPCSESPCQGGSKCIPYHRVCISMNDTSCPQYKCVNSGNCHKYQNKVVCDRNGRRHDSMCSFINNDEQVDYYGYCQVECSAANRRTVCGVNGQTYPSSCHAKGVGVAVDYIGSCKDVPNVSGVCEKVKCPGLPYMNSTKQCHGPTPPDSCCPQCGNMLNILIDHSQLTRNRQALRLHSIDSTDTVNRLRSYIDILECELYGHQTLDGSFVVLLLPSNMTSSLNVKGCQAETIRLANLINRGSPLLTSDPYLSFLVAANHTLSWQQTRPPVVNRPNFGSVSGCGLLKSSSHFIYVLILCALVLITFGGAESCR